MATVLWANYLETNPPWGTSQQSGFVNVGTQFNIGGTVYTITALTPAVFTPDGKGCVGNDAGPLVGQDGLNPLPATSIHQGDTVTFTTLGTVSMASLASAIRVGG